MFSMVEYLLDSVEINPGAPASHVVIWLHGLGADGHDFEGIVPELNMPEQLPVRYVFPHAPMRPVTVNGGEVMPAWYDIVDLGRQVDIGGIHSSDRHLRALIQRELDAGIASEHIVLAGFSQGGAIVLHTGPRFEKPLAGILALSTYSPTVRALANERSTANLKIPIMMTHGLQDPIIPIALAVAARQALIDLHYAVQWHTYPMAHQVCSAQIRDIRAWLLEVLR
jgi:phospholipase/carboxylesterase